MLALKRKVGRIEVGRMRGREVWRLRVRIRGNRKKKRSRVRKRRKIKVLLCRIEK